MGLVKLILRDDVNKLGNAGDLVSVKPGFARNFLLPQGKAILATESRVKELEHQKRVIAERMAKETKDLEALKRRIESVALEFEAQAGEEGKLFGSVTSQQLAQQLAEKGVEIDRRKLVLDEPIKTLGEHTVCVRLRNELIAEVKVTVNPAE
jgi:large subunit ribosomal protein L9